MIRTLATRLWDWLTHDTAPPETETMAVLSEASEREVRLVLHRAGRIYCGLDNYLDASGNFNFSIGTFRRAMREWYDLRELPSVELCRDVLSKVPYVRPMRPGDRRYYRYVSRLVYAGQEC